jgi:hypothetical protein
MGPETTQKYHSSYDTTETCVWQRNLVVAARYQASYKSEIGLYNPLVMQHEV